MFKKLAFYKGQLIINNTFNNVTRKYLEPLHH